MDMYKTAFLYRMRMTARAQSGMPERVLSVSRQFIFASVQFRPNRVHEDTFFSRHVYKTAFLCGMRMTARA